MTSGGSRHLVRRVGALLLAGSLVAAACGDDKNSSDPTAAPTTTAASTVTTTGSTETSTAPATTEAGATTTAAPTGGARTTLFIGSVLAPPTLDITTGSGAAIPAALLYNVYETLVKATGPDKFDPLLAKSYTVSDDGLTYTFKLQTGVTFHNGQPFTANDVLFSFQNSQKNVADGKAPAIIAATFAPVATIAAPDATTVVITLKQRSRDFLFMLSQTGGAIINQSALADIATKPVGTGPFKFDSYVTNSKLRLTAYDGYWGSPKPTLKTVEFRYIGDPKALADSIKSPDGVDIIDNITPDLFKTFQGDPAFQTVSYPTGGETILAMNNSRAPLDNVKVRQAINYALDKEAINEIAEAGLGKLIGSMSSPNDPWYVDLSDTYTYDPEKAKSLLNSAGVSNLKLTLQVPPVPYAKASAPVIQQELGDVGITVELKDIEFPLWIDQVFTKADYDMTIISHVEIRDTALYGNPNYYWRYNSPQVQDLLKQADAAPTVAESNKLYKQVLEQINADAVNGFLFLLPGLTVAKKGITGFPQAAYGLSYDVTGVK